MPASEKKPNRPVQFQPGVAAPVNHEIPSPLAPLRVRRKPRKKRGMARAAKLKE